MKVLHPGVRHSIFRDLRVMMFMANMMDRIYPNFYWISLQECVDEFASVMKKQVGIVLKSLWILFLCFILSLPI